MFRVIVREIFYKKPPSRGLWLYGSTCTVRLCSSQSIPQTVTKNNDQYLAVLWNNGKVDEFPHFYLRENCNCSQCFNPLKNARNMFAPQELDLNVAAESANIDSNQLNVKWTDGHNSVYSSESLQSLRYQTDAEGRRPGVLTEKIQLWGENASFEDGSLPTFNFHQLLEDDKVLYKWLVNLACETGIAKLENIPCERQQLRRLGERVGYLLSTQYGMCYDIKAYSQDVARDIGFTATALPLHSDYVFTHAPPAIGMFHCLVQTDTKGGVNQWIDGFNAAHRLHEEDPELFDILTETPIAYRNITRTEVGNFHTTSRHKLISVDSAGKLSLVGYSDEFRDRHMPLEPKNMKTFYKAYVRFTELLLDSKTSFWYKMKNSDGISMNNHRVLHARNGYEDSTDNNRVFQLAYMDWDCVHSKIRILAEQMGIPSPID